VSIKLRLCFCLSAVLLSSCGYKQNIMFKTSATSNLALQAATAEKNYVIQKDDLLELLVYANKGESLVDPGADPSLNQTTPGRQERQTPPTYLVDQNGIVKFPRIDPIKLEGLTIRQAEEILEKQYEVAFVESFVILKFANKRAVVLGSPGGQVIPLGNENMRLTEVLALAKGISNDGKANNIRVLRGDQVMFADFSTFEGYQKNNIIIQSGDIIYVEPIRRPLVEGVREYGPIISMITSIGTLVVVIITLTGSSDSAK
jgi:polysaccharide biosynthesis/export protein